jgi:hypothetical protein
MHPRVLAEATAVCIPTDNSEIRVLLAAVFKPPGPAWIAADVAELLSFRTKSILACDGNAKHPF